ncbi:acyl-CoA thioesterase [Treponema primitia]|uniref:acyl-CoA thioesterase n=1 Tax=Treponema primitia TaxID=88058 RepID=UPI0039801924
MKIQDLSAELEFSVEFYDVDPMEVVWHGNYVKYFEKARRALLNKIGYGYVEMKASGYAFPVTDIALKFVRPLRFGDRVRARAYLEEYENRLRIKYELSNALTGKITTKGMSTQMAYNIAAADSCFLCPGILIEKVEALLKAGDGEGQG